MRESKELHDKLFELTSGNDPRGFAVISELFEMSKNIWKQYGIDNIILHQNKNIYTIYPMGSDTSGSGNYNYKLIVSPAEIGFARGAADLDNQAIPNLSDPYTSLKNLLKDVKNRSIHIDNEEVLLAPENAGKFANIFLNTITEQLYIDPKSYGEEDEDWKNGLKKRITGDSNPGQPTRFC